jgi:hypothetical protein
MTFEASPFFRGRGRYFQKRGFTPLGHPNYPKQVEEMKRGLRPLKHANNRRV